MKKFLNLLEFELSRFLKFLIPTLLVAGGVQLYVTFTEATAYNNDLEKAMASGDMMERFPTFTFHNITAHGMYELSIVLIILIFMVYSFFTWYSEWFGKNTFVYRLLMLPMNRSSILFAKSTVFLIGGLLAFVFQFGMYFIELQIVERIVASSHYTPVNIHNAQPTFGLLQHLLFPTSIFEFVSTYSFAFGALFSLFTGILIERSFGLQGLIIGVLYFIGYFVLYTIFTGILYTNDFGTTLRPSQIQWMLLAYQLFMIGLGSVISSRILKNKVKV